MKGLAAIRNLKRRFEGFEANINETVRQALQNDEDWLIDLNAFFQLYEKGVNALGVEIASYEPYSLYTVSIKGMLGQPTDRVTLKDTGDFHDSFYVIYREDEFEITASDYKREALVNRYGPEIFGLTPENMAVVRDEIIRPHLEIMLRHGTL